MVPSCKTWLNAAPAVAAVGSTKRPSWPSAIQAEDVAAIPGRHEDVVGHAETELLPQFVGQRLGALDKVGMPVMAGIKALAGGGQRGLGDRLASAGYGADLGARGGDLHHFA